MARNGIKLSLESTDFEWKLSEGQSAHQWARGGGDMGSGWSRGKFWILRTSVCLLKRDFNLIFIAISAFFNTIFIVKWPEKGMAYICAYDLRVNGGLWGGGNMVTNSLRTDVCQINLCLNHFPCFLWLLNIVWNNSILATPSLINFHWVSEEKCLILDYPNTMIIKGHFQISKFNS